MGLSLVQLGWKFKGGVLGLFCSGMWPLEAGWVVLSLLGSGRLRILVAEGVGHPAGTLQVAPSPTWGDSCWADLLDSGPLGVWLAELWGLPGVGAPQGQPGTRGLWPIGEFC